MLIETLIFTTIAFATFIYTFYLLIKKNDTKFVPLLAIEAIGIAIEFIQVYFRENEPNLIIKLL